MKKGDKGLVIQKKNRPIFLMKQNRLMLPKHQIPSRSTWNVCNVKESKINECCQNHSYFCESTGYNHLLLEKKKKFSNCSNVFFPKAHIFKPTLSAMGVIMLSSQKILQTNLKCVKWWYQNEAFYLIALFFFFFLNWSYFAFVLRNCAKYFPSLLPSLAVTCARGTMCSATLSSRTLHWWTFLSMYSTQNNYPILQGRAFLIFWF